MAGAWPLIGNSRIARDQNESARHCYLASVLPSLTTTTSKKKKQNRVERGLGMACARGQREKKTKEPNDIDRAAFFLIAWGSVVAETASEYLWLVSLPLAHVHAHLRRRILPADPVPLLKRCVGGGGACPVALSSLLGGFQFCLLSLL